MQNNKKPNFRELEKERIRSTIRQNRRGERIGIAIPPKPQIVEETEEIKKTRVAAYCRVSTAEDHQVGSFEMQVQHFKAEVEKNPNYELVKIYTDEGISGTSITKRLGFQEMMEDAKAGKIDLILTKSISRFGRNIVDIVSSLRELSSLSPPVEVRFESEGISTGNGNNSLVISILSALAELESQQKSIAITEGIRYRMQEGLYKFNVSSTLGYYRDYTGQLKIEPSEAKIVKYIYKNYLKGSSSIAIAAALTDQEIPTPLGKRKWNSAEVINILRNEKYCGDVLYQKTYTKDYLTHKKVKNRNVLTQWYWKDCHPAIIDRKTWDKVQEELDTRTYSQKGIKKPRKIRNDFTISKVKTGPLSGYLILDAQWNPPEVKKFLEIISDPQYKSMI